MYYSERTKGCYKYITLPYSWTDYIKVINIFPPKLNALRRDLLALGATEFVKSAYLIRRSSSRSILSFTPPLILALNLVSNSEFVSSCIILIELFCKMAAESSTRLPYSCNGKSVTIVHDESLKEIWASSRKKTPLFQLHLPQPPWLGRGKHAAIKQTQA